jgi:hypothetical protein
VLLTLLAPLFTQPVTTRNPFIDPFNFPVDATAKIGQNRFLQIAQGMSNIGREDGVGNITQTL